MGAVHLFLGGRVGVDVKSPSRTHHLNRGAVSGRQASKKERASKELHRNPLESEITFFSKIRSAMWQEPRTPPRAHLESRAQDITSGTNEPVKITFLQAKRD